ncbi:hypothetical protein RB597_004543 [Gaeumannomyces tritici]
MTAASTATISPPDVRGIVGPLLPSLPGAAVATEPAAAILPLLSPILRQRVQLLSAASTEPWIRLLSYDTAKAARLAEVARGDSFEPHPVSGEVEVDWDTDVETRYRRLDHETLQALVVLDAFGLFFRLVYCTGDPQGDGDGWRVGEVSVADQPSPFASFGGKPSITDAESEYKEALQARLAPVAAKSATKHDVASSGAGTSGGYGQQPEEDDDDDYWARYDATPARSPTVKRSPAPGAARQAPGASTSHMAAAEEAYFAQYDSVQPAMDNHDPDEEANLAEAGVVVPPLGLARPAEVEEPQPGETQGVWTLAGGPETTASSLVSHKSIDDDEKERLERLLHPRPSSSVAGSSSTGSSMVAKLEESAERREQSEFGIKQHVSRSIKSLFLLSRAAGIDRDEFERMVKTELDVLGLIED